MPVLEVITTEKVYKLEFSEPIALSELLKGSGLALPCGGNGKCGKCKVKAAGAVSPPCCAEEKLLSAEELASGVRLACYAQAIGDCCVTLFKSEEILTELRGGSEKIESTGDCIACDIGTTTVAVYLYRDGMRINAIGEQNAQASFGGDVITRIGQNEPALLHKAIVAQLRGMFSACIQGYTQKAAIKQIVITGNTVMLHFLAGLDPKGIAVYPFTPLSLFGCTTALNGCFSEYENAEIFLPPAIAAYIGADIVCAVLTAKMCDQEKITLLADIGTNGEMALYKDGVLHTCSTAAGPALEGANIKMGMPAKPGAILSVYAENDRLCYATIGQKPPVGICGTGLISFIACMRRLGAIDETGRIDTHSSFYETVNGEERLKIAESGVYVTQNDIRQFQLAKAAISAGIETLLHESKTAVEEVTSFYLCGGFGSSIDKTQAAQTGLIPTALADKTVSIGNAAGSGAALLLSSKNREKAFEIVKKARVSELSANAFFMEKYVENMCF